MPDMNTADASTFQTSATYRALANSLPLSLLIKATDGRRVFANQAYLTWRGLRWESVAGKRDEDLFPPEIARIYQADDESVMRTGQSLHSVEQSQMADGSNGWIERIKSPIRDSQGQLLGVQVMFWDVTDKINAERSSQFEQQLLNTLLDNLPDSIYFKDLDSRFVRVSRALAQKFGLSDVGEVHGRTDADIFTPEHARGAREDELSVIHSGQPLVDRIERETWRNREDTWCLTTKMPMRDQDGQIIGTFGISRDITDLKRSQVALQQAVQSADAANRAKSEFLANMSHEIRTPMNAMVGMADLLSQTELTDDQRDYVQVIRDSSDALLHLINDILDFSKIEARRMELESVTFSFPKLLQTAVSTVRWKASEKGVQVHLQIDPDLPPRLIGDPGRLRQVLVNLVGNAIKFTDQGHVTLRVERRIAPASEPASHRVPIRFEVIDTGIGIPPDQQSSVLQAFTQADASTTRRFGGTGLGLTISRQLVELMGGELQLTSEVGVGTTFFFDLDIPAAYGPDFGDGPHFGDRPGVDGAVDDEEDLGGDRAAAVVSLRILVAEDGVTNQHVIAGLLRSLGHECSIASDGRETLARWNAEPYDAILMDMHMPVMDGLEATREIRQQELGTHRHTPIIALTAAAMPEDAAACQEAGMDEYLTKPIHLRKLQTTLARLVRDAGERPPAGDGSASASVIEPFSSTSVVIGSDSSSSFELSGKYAGCLDLDSARSRIPGGAAGVLRLAMVFRTECEQLVSQLMQQIPAGQNDDARRTAHTLKGACGLLGAKRLQAIALQIEDAGREGRLGGGEDTGRPEIVDKLLSSLRTESDDVRAALDELLQR